MKKYSYELTDLFCGERNYSFVRRGEITANTMRGALQKAKLGKGFRFYCGNKYEAEYRGMGYSVFIEEME